MKKENNQEFYVEQMDVHYPRRSEIQNEIEDAKENAAFERCTDVITNMIMKYGPVLKRKWAVDEWLRNIHVECFGTKNEWRSFMAEDKKRKLLLQ